MATTLPDLDKVDEAPLGAGANEELAGPPHVAGAGQAATAPVARAERISSVDVLRGFSLMGILLMNIHGFGSSGWNYAIPLTTVHPVFNGPHWHVNTALWFFRWVFAEGKMRALFSMLFGAGVLLMTGRAEARGAGVRTADIYLRRNIWLVVIGMLHCFLVWNGDILFYYGMTGLLLLFPCRNLKAKTLLWTGTLVLLVGGLVVDVTFDTMGHKMQRAAQAAYAVQAAHKPLNEEQKKAIDTWVKGENNWRPTQKKLYEDIAKHQKGYLATRAADAEDSYKQETEAFLPFWADVLGMMLLGMGLFKNGFFSAKLPTKTYAWCAAIGLGVSWPLIFVTCWLAWKGGFDIMKANELTRYPYDLGRILGAIGNAAAVLLLVRLGVGKWVLARIAAVGQMALSNYLLTSISMQTLFVWSRLHWYGYLEYYKLYLVVLCMWAVNLVWSTLWLRRFQFGPAEWMWRSLTYWKRQPMRLEAAALPAVPAR